MLIGITGGAGFIGSRLATRLIEDGHSVALMDNLHPQVHSAPPELPPGADLFVGDVVAPDDWNRWFELVGLPDTIVHLAAETGTGQSLHEASRHGRVNVVGTTELLDALSRAGHRPAQLLLASSRAVYGEGVWLDAAGERHHAPMRTTAQLEAGQWNPIGPDGPLASALANDVDAVEPRPTNVYAATKLAQEHIMSAWCGAFGVPLTVLRLQNVYGAGQAVGNPYTGVLTFFATQLANGGSLDVYEDGDITRDFVHVDDVVEAFRLAVAAPATRRLDIGSGAPTPLVEVASVMTRLADGEAFKVSGRFRSGDVRSAYADISAAREELGWEPAVRPEEGLGGLLQWVTAQVRNAVG